MTILAPTVRRRPAAQAFVVPVVRELAAQLRDAAAGSGW
jgi:hypothetical protein